jgi:hypothetical protein
MAGSTGATGPGGGPAGPTGPTGILSAQTYSVSGTGSTIAYSSSSYAVSPGLSLTITLTAPATLNMYTFGTISIFPGSDGTNTLGSSAQIFSNGIGIANTRQQNSINVFHNYVGSNIIHWSIMSSQLFPAGTYIIDVRVKNTGGAPFEFGKTSVSESSLMVQVFY